MSGLVLLVTHVLHPVHYLAVFLFLNGDVRHGRRRRSSMPVLLTRREPDYVAGPDFLDGAVPALRAAAARCDNKSLAERVRVPCRPCSRLKGYAGALNKGRIGRLKKRVNPHRASEPVCWTFTGRLRAGSFDFHFVIS